MRPRASSASGAGPSAKGGRCPTRPRTTPAPRARRDAPAPFEWDASGEHDPHVSAPRPVEDDGSGTWEPEPAAAGPEPEAERGPEPPAEEPDHRDGEP